MGTFIVTWLQTQIQTIITQLLERDTYCESRITIVDCDGEYLHFYSKCVFINVNINLFVSVSKYFVQVFQSVIRSFEVFATV